MIRRSTGKSPGAAAARRRLARAWLLAALPALLAGCATNALLLEETRRFADRAGEASRAGTAFYDGLVSAEEQRWQTLYMLDPDCIPPRPALRGDDVYVDPVKPEGARDYDWCRTAGAPPHAHVVTRESLAVEYAALSFVAAYVDALAQAATLPEAHGGDNFVEALGDLETLRRVADRDGKPLLDEAQTAAVGGLVDFIAEIGKEALASKKVRAVVERDAARAGKTLEMLADALLADAVMESASAALERQDLKHAVIAASDDPMVRRTVLEGWHAATNRRREVAARIARCEQRAAALPAGQAAAARKYCRAPAAGLVHAARAMHDELLGAHRGDFNPRQLARRAHIAQRRFIALARVFVDWRAAF